jgi:glutathione S-transferase
MRWQSWESGHWDAESVGMVWFEKGSKVVMSLGPAHPAFIKRGEQNFARFAAVLDGCLTGKTWLLGDRLTIADFSVGGVIPNAQAMDLSFAEYPEISRWYAGLCALPGWHTKLST